MCDLRFFRFSGGAVGGSLFDWFGSVCIFGDVFLEATISKIDTPIFNILDIGNLAVIPGSVKGGYSSFYRFSMLAFKMS